MPGSGSSLPELGKSGAGGRSGSPPGDADWPGPRGRTVGGGAMKILLWHVHGGWTDAFVRGQHEYLLPTTPEGAPWGLGRAGRAWPESVREVPPDELQGLDIDAVILQRPEELDLAGRLMGRTPGLDVAAFYVEHNTPKPDAAASVHPLADQSRIPIIHVTHFNRLYWDNGRAKSAVIEHGIPDPGALYTGSQERFGTMINEPVRRWRTTGTDLLPDFAGIAPVELFGIGGSEVATKLGLPAGRLTWQGDLPTAEAHRQLAANRAYLHTARWTSLGLSLLEAMFLAMPIIALAATEACRAVPPEAGTVSNDLGELKGAAGRFIADPDFAAACGRAARSAAVGKYGLEQFLQRWDLALSQ